MKASRREVALIRAQLKLALPSATLGTLIGAVLALATSNPIYAHDYTPTAYYPYRLGPGNANYWNQDSPISQDAVDAWNYWLGSQYGVSAHFELMWCVVNKSCVLFMNDGETINGTSCTVPETVSGSWAQTYLASGGAANLPGEQCRFGSSTYPVYVVIVNNEQSFSTKQKQHIGRHEVGHAMNLNDTTWPCTNDTHPFPGTWRYPIMKNSSANCSGFSTDPPIAATSNEMVWVLNRNGWWW